MERIAPLRRFFLRAFDIGVGVGFELSVFGYLERALGFDRMAMACGENSITRWRAVRRLSSRIRIPTWR